LFSFLTNAGALINTVVTDLEDGTSIVTSIITQLESLLQSIDDTLTEITNEENSNDNNNSNKNSISNSESNTMSSSSTSSSSTSSSSYILADVVVDTSYTIDTVAIQSLAAQILMTESLLACMTPVANFGLVGQPCGAPAAPTSSQQATAPSQQATVPSQTIDAPSTPTTTIDLQNEGNGSGKCTIYKYGTISQADQAGRLGCLSDYNADPSTFENCAGVVWYKFLKSPTQDCYNACVSCLANSIIAGADAVQCAATGICLMGYSLPPS
jgi:hypothetical protein